MASVIYNKFLADLAAGSVDLENDDIRVQLHTSTYTPDKDHTIGNVTNEISTTAYTAGGMTLANTSITQDDSNDWMMWDADDVTWSNATITARHAVVVDITASSLAVCCVDFGSDQSSTSDDFKIQWDSNGLMTLAQS